jgi:hypothetical protein
VALYGNQIGRYRTVVQRESDRRDELDRQSDGALLREYMAYLRPNKTKNYESAYIYI